MVNHSIGTLTGQLIKQLGQTRRKRGNCKALQLDAADSMPVLISLNYNAHACMPSLKSFNLSVAIL